MSHYKTHSVERYDYLWFQRYQAAGNLEDVEWIQQFVKLSRQEKGRFLNNEVENPRFKCAFKGDTAPMIVAFSNLKEEILQTEKNEIVRDLYAAKIVKEILRQTMYEDTRHGNDVDFFDRSIRIYGQPKKRYFAYVAARIQAELQKDLPGLPKKSRQRLELVFSKIDTTGAAITIDVLPQPSEERGSHVSSAEVKVIFDETINKYQLEGWQTEVDVAATRSRFAVMPVRRIVCIPGDTMYYVDS